MFLRFILRALEYRKQRLLLSFSALAIGAALATVLFGIYGTVERRMREEFRSYGANIAAVPESGKTIPLEIVSAAEKLGATAAPFLITSSGSLVVAGFDPAKSVAMTSYWHVDGTRECLAGENLRLAIGAHTPLCTITGIVRTGGAEDNELLVPFAAAANLAGIHDAASVIEIRAPGDQVESVRAALAKQFPAADVRTIRAVAGTESNVVLKIRASLFLLTMVILGITTLCVTSNFSEMVIERSKEIGILKALGGAERRIAALLRLRIRRSRARRHAGRIRGGPARRGCHRTRGFRRGFSRRCELARLRRSRGRYAGGGGHCNGDRRLAHLDHPARDHSEGRMSLHRTH